MSAVRGQQVGRRSAVSRSAAQLVSRSASQQVSGHRTAGQQSAVGQSVGR